MSDTAADGGLLDGTTGSRFAYDPAVLRYGEGATAALGDELAEQHCERALVVTGQTVGTTPAVMEPVRDGLDDRLVGVFAETTPAKRLVTAVDGAAAVGEHDADALVAVGGGSSLDTAKAIAAVAADDRSTDAIAAEFAERATLTVPDDPLPIVAVPTTFAGADQSQGAGLTADPAGDLVAEPVDGGLGAPALHPVAAIYDPALFATTPRRVLVGSAMNGLDKGIETLYSRHATPVTDATAVRGLSRVREGLASFADDIDDAGLDGDGSDDDGRDGDDAGDAGRGGEDSTVDESDGLAAAVEGLLLVQYGASRADCTTLGPIHAVGQAVSATGVHQGVAHAVVAPHVLGALFEETDGRRALLAQALRRPATGAAVTENLTEVVIEELVALRDGLGLPTRLADVDGLDRDALPEIASDAASHRFLENGPAGWEPDAEAFRQLLEDAW